MVTRRGIQRPLGADAQSIMPGDPHPRLDVILSDEWARCALVLQGCRGTEGPAQNSADSETPWGAKWGATDHCTRVDGCGHAWTSDPLTVPTDACIRTRTDPQVDSAGFGFESRGAHKRAGQKLFVALNRP